MKNTFSKLSLLLILIISEFFIPYNLYSQNWTPIGPDDFNRPSLYEAEYTSIAKDSSDNPWLIYADELNSYKATVVKLVNNIWTIQGIAGFSAGRVAYSNISFDKENNPWVVYQDGGNLGKITVQKFVNGNWMVQGTSGFSLDSVFFTNIAIDSNNNPWVVFKDKGNNRKITVMKLENGVWTVQGNPGFSAGRVDYTDICIDHFNNPWVVYVDRLSVSNGNAYVQKFVGGSWVSYGMASTAGSRSYTNITVDSRNNPWVICGGFTSQNVTKYEFGSWKVQGHVATQSSQNSLSNTDIFIDKNDDVWIVYNLDSNKTSNGYVAKFVNSKWQIQGGKEFEFRGVSSSRGPIYSSMVVNKKGEPVIAYTNGYSSKDKNKAIVKTLVNGSWEGLYCLGITNSSPFNSAMTIDKQGIPWIVYNLDDENLLVLKLVNGTWQIQGNGKIYTSTCWYPRIVIDNKGLPWVTYTQPFSGNNKLRVMTLDNKGKWYEPGIYGGNYRGIKPTITIDNNNTPWVAWSGFGDKGSFVIKLDSGIWKLQGGASGIEPLQYISNQTYLAIDKKYNPWVAYTLQSDPKKCFLKTLINGYWVQQGSSGYFNPDFKLDTADNPCLIFIDTLSSKTNVLKLINGNWIQQNNVLDSISISNLYFDSKNNLWGLCYEKSKFPRIKIVKLINGYWVEQGNQPVSSAAVSLKLLEVDLNSGSAYVGYSDNGLWLKELYNCNPPKIYIESTSKSTCVNGDVTFERIAAGIHNTYQWQDSTIMHNWFDIINATTSKLDLNNLTMNNHGNKYRCKVSTPCGSDSSQYAQLLINPLPIAIAGNDTTIFSGSSINIGSTSHFGNLYSWSSKPSGFNSNISNPSISPIVSTTYYLKVTSSMGCVEYDTIFVTVIKQNSVNPNLDKNNETLIQTYPNPFNSEFDVTLALNDIDCQVRLLDVNGKCVFNSKIELLNENTNFKIDSKDLPSGVYLLNISGTSIYKSIKIIKQ